MQKGRESGSSGGYACSEQSYSSLATDGNWYFPLSPLTRPNWSNGPTFTVPNNYLHLLKRGIEIEHTHCVLSSH